MLVQWGREIAVLCGKMSAANISNDTEGLIEFRGQQTSLKEKLKSILYSIGINPSEDVIKEVKFRTLSTNEFRRTKLPAVVSQVLGRRSKLNRFTFCFPTFVSQYC